MIKPKDLNFPLKILCPRSLSQVRIILFSAISIISQFLAFLFIPKSMIYLQFLFCKNFYFNSTNSIQIYFRDLMYREKDPSSAIFTVIHTNIMAKVIFENIREIIDFHKYIGQGDLKVKADISCINYWQRS